MEQYLGLLKRVLTEGKTQFNERTGQLMIVKSGDQYYCDFSKGFPLVTTKDVPIRWIGEELFWMFRGETDAYNLFTKGKGVDIWNRNAFQHYLDRSGFEVAVPKNTPLWSDLYKEYNTFMKDNRKFGLVVDGQSVKTASLEGKFDPEDSSLGPIYGEQWRRWRDYKGGEIDQLKKIIRSIIADPGSRYHFMNAWNVAQIDEMAIGLCHPNVHFTITGDKNLEAHMFQRSCDLFLGVPFNTAQYGLFTHLIAQETGMNPVGFYHTFSNVHIYNGISPRSNFLLDPNNLSQLQDRVKNANKPENFLEIKDWYLKNVPPESAGNERKDHVPFVLEQLSKEHKPLPKLTMANIPFFDMINMPAKEVLKLEGYNPHKWDSKAEMAA